MQTEFSGALKLERPRKSHSLTGPSPNVARCRMSIPFGRWEREVLLRNKAQHRSGFVIFYLKKRTAGGNFIRIRPKLCHLCEASKDRESPNSPVKGRAFDLETLPGRSPKWNLTWSLKSKECSNYSVERLVLRNSMGQIVASKQATFKAFGTNNRPKTSWKAEVCFSLQLRKIQPARLFIVGLAICAQTSVADLFEVGGMAWWDGERGMGTHSGKISHRDCTESVVLWMRSLYSYGTFLMIGILSRILFAAPRQYEIFQLNLQYLLSKSRIFFSILSRLPAHPAINAVGQPSPLGGCWANGVNTRDRRWGGSVGCWSHCNLGCWYYGHFAGFNGTYRYWYFPRKTQLFYKSPSKTWWDWLEADPFFFLKWFPFIVFVGETPWMKPWSCGTLKDLDEFWDDIYLPSWAPKITYHFLEGSFWW